MLKKKAKLPISFIIIGIIVLLLGITLFIKNPWTILSFLGTRSSFPHMQKKTNTPSEIGMIIQTKDPKEQSLQYRKLVERIGPEEAQQALFSSGLPFDGATHLLNHTVGEWLYKKYGTAGLIHCKDYFLSSCYHGFVLEAVADKGMSILDEVMQHCWTVGRPTATQCAHAIGHGMLAWEGYANLTTALSDCDKFVTSSPNFPVYNCHDGVFMENIYALHDGGRLSPDRWVNPKDHLYPCNDPRIGEQYINACWSNQPMLMFQQFHGDIKKVADECLILTNKEYQTTCFDALARQINPMTQGNIQAVFNLCSYLPGEWKNQCVISNAKAFFSVGDHDKPFKICAGLDTLNQNACYETLMRSIIAYELPKQEHETLCRRLPDTLQEGCLDKSATQHLTK